VQRLVHIADEVRQKFQRLDPVFLRGLTIREHTPKPHDGTDDAIATLTSRAAS